DKNSWESTIAHELFHHWFGDYVTAESWANIAVNEAFATYGEYLWFEHKYGKDKANSLLYNKMQEYFLSQEEDKNLVRFYYDDKEDVFDAVSYQKGGVILNMLRNYLGDKAFFEGLTTYLTENAFGTGEVHQLRLAFEKVSGRDLNWFFNQWFYGNGHIEMNVSYDYSLVNNTVTVNISQAGKTFIFPLTIDVYEKGGKVTHHEVWVNKESQSFTLPFDKRPKLINIDAKHLLLAKINDKKTIDHYIFQYHNAPHFLDRKLALEAIVNEQEQNKEVFETFVKALNDPSDELQIYTLNHLNLFDKHSKKSVIRKIEKLAENAPKTLVRASAIKVLGKLIDPTYKPIFKRGMESESFAVINSSIVSLYEIDKALALEKIKTLPKNTKKYFAESITNIYIKEKDKSELPFIANHLLAGLFMSQDKHIQSMYGEAFRWIAESDNQKAISNLTNELVSMGKRYKKYGADKTAISMLNQVLFLQQQAKHKNEKEIVKILKMGIGKLME
ncbi:MAG: M1 family peptidase, partial [Flavobacteriaceae bacterium]|nr:M1 family peptidase [Flavobacteriaceae bacterium]